MLAENYVLHDHHDFRHAGRESERRLISSLRTAFPDLRFTVKDQVAEKDKIATRYAAHAGRLTLPHRVAPDARPLLGVGVNVARFADGVIVEQWVDWSSVLAVP